MLFIGLALHSHRNQFMIPKLFDIVIMDEASQCTMTHALPLIFRGKSFAAIGDPDQLSSIPSLQLVKKCNY